MRPALLVITLAACGSDQPPPKGPITADITHYDLTFDLDSRAAHASVTATVTTGGDCWTLPVRTTDLANIELDHKSVASAAIDATTITACGAGYPAGTTLVLDLDQTIPLAVLGQSQVGFSTATDSAGNKFTYLLSWVNECDRFTPCDNAPEKFATYHFDVTHDAATVVRCPGDIADVSATETTCDFGYDGGPTYSTFGVVAYNAWTQTDLGMFGGVHVTMYDKASTGILAKITPAYHDGYVSWLESQFGPYPYGSELRVLTGPTYWGGFEHPGNITLNDRLARTIGSVYANEAAHTLDHEITHMWAGNQTTLADTYDFVWKESMAEYLSYVWEDMNDQTVSGKTSGAWKTFAQSAMYYPVPTDHPELLLFYGDVYGPGPMILFHQLEVMTSRAQVLAAIKDVLGTPHALSVDELITALEQHTGMSLTTYFDGWLRGTGVPPWPKFDVTYTQASNSLVLHQTNPAAGVRGCHFHVALNGANAGEQQLVAVDTFTNGNEQTLTVPAPAFTVTAVVLDPLNECLVFTNTTSPITTRRHPWIVGEDSGISAAP
jgi:aminopeptidase N